MTYIVVGCLDWIGYHLTQKLLHSGERVLGVDTVTSTMQEHFLLSIGRNSLFEQWNTLDQLRDTDQWKQANKLIIVKPELQASTSDVFNDFTAFVLSEQQNSVEINGVFIYVPLVYGEWMSRDNDGLWNNDKYIRFDSREFTRNGVYIEDFIAACLQITNSRLTNNGFICKPLKQQVEKDKSEKRTIYIRESEPLDRRMEYLDKHYYQFKQIYQHHL